MNERLDQLMRAEGLTSAKFAEILSVQPSSISHLLSGRNNPNFDFISKLLLMFPRLNPHWIINGSGDMYLADQKPMEKQISTDNYKSDSTDIFTRNSPETPTQSSEKQDDQPVKYVTSTPDLFAQNPHNVPQHQPEVIVEQTQIGELNDISPSKSDTSTEQKATSSRSVERVLLLYNDKTFEFFNR